MPKLMPKVITYKCKHMSACRDAGNDDKCGTCKHNEILLEAISESKKKSFYEQYTEEESE